MHNAAQLKKIGRVGVFLGGRSHERSISLKSGKAVYKALKNSGANVIAIDTANGYKSKLKKNQINTAFIALHGAGGEDGTIQSILERHTIPYAGSGPKSSFAAFDKRISKKIFKQKNIPTPEYQVINKSNWKQVVRKWNPPFVIKPVNEGSSIGVVFFDKASRHDLIKKNVERYGTCLIEKKIEGREFTVGILGHRALPVIELKPKRAFYDFKAKYTKGMTQYLVPAPISKKESRILQKIALKTHKALKLKDLSRIDFRVDFDGRPFVLEANSIPGFTETSLLPKAAQQVGINFSDLCIFLLKQAKIGKE